MCRSQRSFRGQTWVISLGSKYLYSPNYLSVCFFETKSLCSPGWPQTCRLSSSLTLFRASAALWATTSRLFFEIGSCCISLTGPDTQCVSQAELVAILLLADKWWYRSVYHHHTQLSLDWATCASLATCARLRVVVFNWNPQFVSPFRFQYCINKNHLWADVENLWLFLPFRVFQFWLLD